MSRTFGDIWLSDDGTTWIVDCEAHVRSRLKRVFQQVDTKEVDDLLLTANDETSRDLLWFLDRYPMRVHDLDELRKRAAEFDTRMEVMASVLAGDYTPPSAGLQMAIPARDYQDQAATLAHCTRGVLLADELGLGKTVSAIRLMSMAGSLPALVVVPTHLQHQWQDELAAFLPGARVHIVKTMRPYTIGVADVVIITYHKIAKWSDYFIGRFNTVVFDEAHELRKNDSQKYAGCMASAFGATNRMGLTATPIWNYGGEFHNILSVLNPGALGTWDEFAREWCEYYYDQDKAKIADPAAFGSYLLENGLMLRRTKADVGRELPTLSTVHQIVPSDESILCEVKANSVQLARILVQHGGSGFTKMKAAGELDAKVRQATGVAKAAYVAAFVKMLLDEGKPVVLAGWHHAVYRIWAETLADYRPVMFTGKESPAAKREAARRFKYGETNLMIMSLRSGAGLDGLQKRCSTVVFGELDWSPGAHEQLVGRFYRDQQTEPVFAYYLTSDSGSDPIIVDVLGVKTGQSHGVRDPNHREVLAKQADEGHIRRLAESILAAA